MCTLITALYKYQLYMVYIDVMMCNYLDSAIRFTIDLLCLYRMCVSIEPGLPGFQAVDRGEARA